MQQLCFLSILMAATYQILLFITSWLNIGQYLPHESVSSCNELKQSI